MKLSIKSLKNKFHKILRPEFEDQKLTSFSGLVIFQALFSRLDIKSKLSECFKHLATSSGYGHSIITLLLITHLIIGYRRLSDIKYYCDDPIVLRTLGLNKLPSVATVSRMLSQHDEKSVANVRGLSRNIVLDRIACEQFSRITLDFDGTVQSTSRHAEGTAVGFNKKKKGARSYYPLLCTISQTGQVLDVHHRPGNVHDSNGATHFIERCVRAVMDAAPNSKIEVRTDSAFFSEEIIETLQSLDVEFTASVPFARYTELKGMLEGRKRWKKSDDQTSFFETDWKPKSWENNFRFLFVRTKSKKQNKKPIQLDMFEPYEYGYEFKVTITNKSVKMKKVVRFHNGRGCQEGFIGELKSHCQLDYVPVRKKTGNQIFLFSSIMAHNMNRELQMIADVRIRNTTEKRNTLWVFKTINSIRQNIINCAGRITRPQGKLKLTMNKNNATKSELLHYLDALDCIA